MVKENCLIWRNKGKIQDKGQNQNKGQNKGQNQDNGQIQVRIKVKSVRACVCVRELHPRSIYRGLKSLTVVFLSKTHRLILLCHHFDTRRVVHNTPFRQR